MTSTCNSEIYHQTPLETGPPTLSKPPAKRFRARYQTEQKGSRGRVLNSDGGSVQLQLNGPIPSKGSVVVSVVNPRSNYSLHPSYELTRNTWEFSKGEGRILTVDLEGLIVLTIPKKNRSGVDRSSRGIAVLKFEVKYESGNNPPEIYSDILLDDSFARYRKIAIKSHICGIHSQTTDNLWIQTVADINPKVEACFFGSVSGKPWKRVSTCTVTSCLVKTTTPAHDFIISSEVPVKVKLIVDDDGVCIESEPFFLSYSPELQNRTSIPLEECEFEKMDMKNDHDLLDRKRKTTNNSNNIAGGSKRMRECPSDCQVEEQSIHENEPPSIQHQNISHVPNNSSGKSSLEGTQSYIIGRSAVDEKRKKAFGGTERAFLEGGQEKWRKNTLSASNVKNAIQVSSTQNLKSSILPHKPCEKLTCNIEAKIQTVSSCNSYEADEKHALASSFDQESLASFLEWVDTPDIFSCMNQDSSTFDNNYSSSSICPGNNCLYEQAGLDSSEHLHMSTEIVSHRMGGNGTPKDVPLQQLDHPPGCSSIDGITNRSLSISPLSHEIHSPRTNQLPYSLDMLAQQNAHDQPDLLNLSPGDQESRELEFFANTVDAWNSLPDDVKQDLGNI